MIHKTFDHNLCSWPVKAAFFCAALFGACSGVLPRALADETEEIQQIQKAAVPAQKAVGVRPKTELQAAKPAATVPAAKPVASVATTPPAARPPAAATNAVAPVMTLAQAQAEIASLRAQVAKLQAEVRRGQIDSHYNMGCVFRACNQYRRAEEEFLKVLALNPDDAGTHYNLGVLYDDNLRNRPKARLHYQRFVELSPQDPDAGKVQEWLTTLP
jgi:tetratricopeptide (TPR) repeat protein